MRYFILLMFAACGWSAVDQSIGAGPLLGAGPYVSTSATPSGAAGGDLTGTYPNPTLAAAGTAGTYVVVTTDAKGRVTSGTASPLPVANGGTASTTAATARAALGVAQFDFTGMIEVPTAKTYTLIPTATTGYTFTSVTIYTLSGTATANFKIGSTSITGASAIAVTSTPQTIALSAANVAVATDTVTLVITAPSSAVDLVFNLGFTR